MSKATKKAPKTEEALEPKKKVRKLTKLQKIFFWSFGTILVLGGISTAYAFQYNNRYLPRTYVGGVAIGGLTRSEAEVVLASRRDTFLATPLTLTYAEKSWEMKPADLGTSISATDQLEQLWNEEKSGDAWVQLKKLFAAPLSPRYAEVSVIALSESGKQALQETVLSTIEKAMHETTLEFSIKEVKVVLGTPGEKLHIAALEDAIAEAFKKGTSIVSLSLGEASPEVSAELAEAARLRATELLKGTLTVKLGESSFPVENTKLASWLTTDVKRNAAGEAIGLLLVVKSGFADELKTWAASVNRAPVNARIAVDGAGVKVVAPDKNGQAVDESGTITTFASFLNGSDTTGIVTGIVSVARAEVRADTLEELGIRELVGSATTDFSGSPTNRAFNIKKGAASLNQLLVKPGAIFSTIGTLGPIEVSTGYLPELVIKGNRTTPEAGGGLCQVSTTLFRSVLNAGMPIEERQNHAYRVGYYERGVGPGLDATIYDPKPDFRWKNDFPSAVYVQSQVVGTKITFDIFGTKDGRSSTISAPTILAEYKVGAPIYAETDTLPKGTTKQVETAHDGAKTSVTYKVMRGGAEIYSKTFISIYKAWPAQYLVGTKEVEPTPPPA